ncbi:MAG: hypothetical protein ACI8RZ_007208, partial [Myxococcota bacterium]
MITAASFAVIIPVQWLRGGEMLITLLLACGDKDTAQPTDDTGPIDTGQDSGDTAPIGCGSIASGDVIL